MTTSSRPINLDLTRMKFPPMAIISIMHRLSGVLLFLLLPLVLYLLQQSLRSPESFMILQQTLSSFAMKFSLWVLVSAVCFHFFAGIRHMAMDCGLAEGLQTARLTAYFIMVLEVIVMILIGVWLW
ncbi:MAG: succinate dehydrogenase, cytochrome b556 subunit [Gammaproteobacteria bacterium]|nr:succinate dehydrogenase, cytochrome b556 subunit [Gammaproteobacteria bacterium]